MTKISHRALKIIKVWVQKRNEKRSRKIYVLSNVIYVPISRESIGDPEKVKEEDVSLRSILSLNRKLVEEGLDLTRVVQRDSSRIAYGIGRVSYDSIYDYINSKRAYKMISHQEVNLMMQQRRLTRATSRIFQKGEFYAAIISVDNGKFLILRLENNEVKPRIVDTFKTEKPVEEITRMLKKINFN